MNDEVPIAPALLERIDSAFGPGSRPRTVSVLEGGHSGLTYKYRIAGPDRDEAFVIKAVPEGQKPVGRNDVIRQAKVIAALSDRGLPVPRVPVVDDTPPAWFAMTFEAGDALEPVMSFEPCSSTLITNRWRVAAETLALLHAVDITGEPFTDEPAATPADELERWSRTMFSVPEELRPQGEALVEELRLSVPEPMTPSVTHGDYRLGNLLFSDSELHGIVDWEIWGVGDRRVDLGWFLAFLDQACFPGLGAERPEVPSIDTVMQHYSGSSEPIVELEWFLALGRMKLAAIQAHNLKRHRQGKHTDPYLETLPPTIAALIDSGLKIIAHTSR